MINIKKLLLSSLFSILLFLCILHVPAVTGEIRIGRKTSRVYAANTDKIKADKAFLKRNGISTDTVKLARLLRTGLSLELSEKDKTKIKSLITQLSADKWRERRKASRQLSKMGPAIQPFIFPLLKDNNPEVRRRAKLVLRNIYIGNARKTDVFCAAVRLLTKDSIVGIEKTLLQLLPNAEPPLQKAIIHALAKYPQDKTAKALIKIYRKEDTPLPIRLSVLDSLAKFSQKHVAEFFVSLINKEKRQALRLRAIFLSGKIKGLARLIIPALIKLLHDKDETVRLQAVISLGMHSGKNFGESHAKWSEWWEKKIRLKKKILQPNKKKINRQT